MSDSTYYRDHWLTVEPERLDAYEEMFRWRPQLEPLLAPARLSPGLAVVDYGCGPGHLTVELARRVGPGGPRARARPQRRVPAPHAARAEAEGVAGCVTVHHVTSDGIPLPPGTLDRVVCKNVLEYVDDPARTLASFRRRSGPAASRT